MVPKPNCNHVPAPICLAKALHHERTQYPRRLRRRKRDKAPIKRRFKVRVIVQPLPMNLTLCFDPTPMVVTIVATSTQMSAVKLTATTTSPTPILVTVYNLVHSRIQEIPNPFMRFQGEKDSSISNGDNPSKAQQPKATAAVTAPQRTPHGQIPCQPLLTYLSQGHHGQFPQMKPPCSLKQKRQKTGPHQR